MALSNEQVEVVDVASGKGVVMRKAVKKGDFLVQFQGYTRVGYDNVPVEERAHALLVDTPKDEWLIDTGTLSDRHPCH